MTKNLMALLLILALFSCNKEVEFISLPPFTVYPNPFTDSFLLTLDANIQGSRMYVFLPAMKKWW